MFRRTVTVAATAVFIMTLSITAGSANPVCTDRQARCSTTGSVTGAGGATLQPVDRSPYAEPLDALGGQTLAQYLAERRTHDPRLDRSG